MTAFVEWVAREALPLWADAGFDADAGRFHERLDTHARPIAVPHRAMVQARQVWVYAHAASEGLLTGGLPLAERAMASLRRDFEVDAGGGTRFAFAIDPRDGRVVSDLRDTYAHAFVLLAIAALHRATGDPALLALADRIFAFLDAELADAAHGGHHDALPHAAVPTKRQNPQMHLLEACLALDEAAPGRGYIERADAIVRLFAARLFDARHGVVVEHFAPDWTDHADAARCRRFEPGHHFEWIWLLDRYAAAGGGRRAGWRERLSGPARAYGLSPSGLIYDELDCERRVTRASHRLWPHTEAIKAAAAAHDDGESGALEFARAMTDTLATHFLGRPFAGGWIDHIGPDFAPIVDHVPASSLYHLVLAATEAARAFGGGSGDAEMREHPRQTPRSVA